MIVEQVTPNIKEKDAIDRKQNVITADSFCKNRAQRANTALPYVVSGGRISFKKKTNCTVISNDMYIIIYTEKGKCTLKDTNSCEDSKVGSFFVIRPNAKLELITLTDDFICDVYYVRGKEMEIYDKALFTDKESDLFIHYSFGNKEIFTFTTSRMNNLITGNSEEAFYLEASLVQNFMTLLITYVLRKPKVIETIPEHVACAKNIIDKRYYEPLNLDILQKETKANKFHLCRDFTKYIGSSPVQYLNKTRIDKSKELMIMTNDTVHSVGATVGIPNTNHFINLFKRSTGLTPLQFRIVHSKAVKQFNFE